MSMAICVFCSSQDSIAPKYFEVARELGAEIGRRGNTLVYGAGGAGLMGAVARAARAHGARVVGVVPEALHRTGIIFEETDELIVTKDLRERKGIMDQRADAFIVLPGGFGTMDELFETLTLIQTGRMERVPIVLFGKNFWDRAINFSFLAEQGTISPGDDQLITFVETAEEAWAHIAAFYKL